MTSPALWTTLNRLEERLGGAYLPVPITYAITPLSSTDEEATIGRPALACGGRQRLREGLQSPVWSVSPLEVLCGVRSQDRRDDDPDSSAGPHLTSMSLLLRV